MNATWPKERIPELPLKICSPITSTAVTSRFSVIPMYSAPRS